MARDLGLMTIERRNFVQGILKLQDKRIANENINNNNNNNYNRNNNNNANNQKHPMYAYLIDNEQLTNLDNIYQFKHTINTYITHLQQTLLSRYSCVLFIFFF